VTDRYLPPEETLKRYIGRELSPRRCQHSLGVADLAGQMAGKMGLDPAPARVAGLLHDHMRETEPAELLRIARSLGFALHMMEIRYPVLLHSPIGAALLPEKFGIRDPEILEAVRYHTTGAGRMGLLARIVFTADLLEPSRNYPGVEELRQVAERDPEAGFEVCVQHHLVHLIDRKRQLHPDTVDCWNHCVNKEDGFGRIG